MKNKFLKAILSGFVLTALFLTGCSGTDIARPEKPGVTQNANTTNLTEKTAPVPAQTNQESTSSSINKNTDKRLLPAVITKNIDGDTVQVNINDRTETIRMLCVDTPETHHPRLGVQPFGPEASAYTKKILPVGTKVQIEPGIGDGRDKYGRLLGYIYINGKMFNKMLLEQGLARVAYVYAPNTKYVDDFYSIQKTAQEKGIGIWSIENYAQADGYHKEEAGGTATQPSKSGSTSGGNVQNKPSDDQDCKGKIKGNANSHIYHVPGGSFYDSTMNNIVWFCSEKEAQNAGYRKSKR